MELGERYRLLHFSEAEAIGEEDVIEFWEREQALPRDQARERVREVAIVALEERGRVVAVSTVFMRRSPQLRTEMWNYRTFVGREHRRSALGLLLLRRTRQHLEQQFVSGLDTRAPGVMFELENPELKQARTEAIWEHPGAPGKRWTFIGENTRGEHVRVYYFPGAVAPPPG